MDPTENPFLYFLLRSDLCHRNFFSFQKHQESRTMLKHTNNNNKKEQWECIRVFTATSFSLQTISCRLWNSIQPPSLFWCGLRKHQSTPQKWKYFNPHILAADSTKLLVTFERGIQGSAIISLHKCVPLWTLKSQTSSVSAEPSHMRIELNLPTILWVAENTAGKPGLSQRLSSNGSRLKEIGFHYYSFLKNPLLKITFGLQHDLFS